MARITSIIATFLIAGCATTSGPPRSTQARQSGSPVAQDAEPTRRIDLILPRLGGGEVSVADFRGRLVVITLFTTWSLRSQAEAPLFVELQQKHRRELTVLGIALDIQGEELVRTYAKVMGLTFDVLLAAPDDLDLIQALGPTSQVPRTVLLDRHGRLVLDHVGQTDFPVLNARVRELLVPADS